MITPVPAAFLRAEICWESLAAIDLFTAEIYTWAEVARYAEYYGGNVYTSYNWVVPWEKDTPGP